MPTEQLEQLLQSLSSVYWNMDYYEFLQRTGFRDDPYALEKFKTFQQMYQLMTQFDSETLQKLLSA
ncbi:hypothetical protein PN462_21105 [Spirulina sp. CS-785/01]|uniref:hypothetical protein n=1 Tax=Spirulina sp. CS-785/01 TaxID=3021716 RepID=UPI00232D8846|nr:hypothetical protein [Spirulina sp. CS-785/01]MDB9315625.1 hypothetical protein [Spirulina sp. CS-785/01]